MEALERIPILIMTLVAMLCGHARALTMNVVVDVGPAGLIADQLNSNPINDLNGIALNGQTLTLNISFANQGWTATYSDAYEIGLSLNTDAGNHPGFTTGSGYVLDRAGNPVGLPASFGSADTSTGDMEVGLFPLNYHDDLALLGGAHLLLTLPNDPRVFITGANMSLYDNTGSHPFGVETIPSLPDHSSTSLPLALALAGVWAVRRSLTAALH